MTTITELVLLIKELEARIESLETAKSAQQKKWLNIEQVADMLNVKVSTIHAKTMNKEIPFYKAGKNLLFNREEIEQYLYENKRHSIKK